MKIIEKIKKVLSDRKEQRERKTQKIQADIFSLGFNKIKFPILIQDGDDLTAVHDFEHFISDSDIHFFEFEATVKLIDSEGRQFTWGYNFVFKTNFPNNFVQNMTLEEVKEIADKYFKNSKVKPELGSASTTKELIDILSEYL